MTALTADRNTEERKGGRLAAPVAADTRLFAGSLGCLDASGNAVPGATATTLHAVGRVLRQYDNRGGVAGALTVEMDRGMFRWANSAGGDEITAADIGDVCWVVDDQTVAKTSGSSTRSRAGIVADVDSSGVWVDTTTNVVAQAGAMLAANNLSDLGSAATARTNLGGNQAPLVVDVADLSGTDVYRVVSPVAGTLSKIHSVLAAALATGDATITASIDSVAVTDGVVTITQSGSAAGDVDVATPSAANTVAVGDVIELTVGGPNTAAVAATVTLTILV